MDDERRVVRGIQYPQTSGLAITSCVLGILSVIVFLAAVTIHGSPVIDLLALCLLVALPLTTIFGIIALAQIANSPDTYKGRGIAVAGTIIGAIGVLVIMMPIFMPRGRTPQRTSCLNNLTQIGTAVNMYMSDWDDKYPLVSGPGREFERVLGHTYNYRTKSNDGERRWFQNLLAPYAKNKKIFMCPSQGEDAQWRVKGRTVTYYRNRHGGYTFDAAKTPDTHGVGNPEKKPVVKAPQGSSTEGLLLENDPPTSYWFNAVAVCRLENGGTKVISGQSEEICARTADAPIVWDTPCGFTAGRSKDAQLAHEDVINVCYADGHAKPYQIPNPKLDEWTKDHFGNTHGYEGWFEEY